jgi:Ca-activated chloride channel family protein
MEVISQEIAPNNTSKKRIPVMKYILFWGATLVMLSGFKAMGQTKPASPVRILLIFDASNSMKANYEGIPRLEVAKQLLSKIVDSLQRIPNLELGLRIFGSVTVYPPGDCNDSKLVVPFAKGNIALIKSKVQPLKPTGITPIAHSLTLAAEDFPNKPGTNIILLITDGIEECGGDPCEAAKKLREKGIVFKPYIVGIGLSQEQSRSFDCVGDYFSAEDINAVSHVVGLVVSQASYKTTVQVNLLDKGGNPTETNSNMTFYDHFSGDIRYNYMHTMNGLGYPDTLRLDPVPTYKLVVHTIPPVEKDNIKLEQGRHNIIAVDVPQGKLQVRRSNGTYNFNYKIKFIVRKHDDGGILNVQDLNTEEKYIVDNYDLEVLTLPRIYLDNIAVDQSRTTNLEIPGAGELKLMTGEVGSGSIYLEDGKDLRWVCNLDNNQSLQNFYLQPGRYRVEFRARSRKESAYTVEKKFNIEADKSITVNLY